jgi:serine/threonine protein kinase
MDLYDWNLKEFMMLNNRIDYTFFKMICYQMARGLLYIHSIGICHRDIRPHNILLKKNGRLVICDFGSAKMMRST